MGGFHIVINYLSLLGKKIAGSGIEDLLIESGVLWHCASHSRIKMPKHVSLAISLRHLTGSKQLVTMLSRMGHCSSYDEVEIIDTSLAREILA